MTTARKKAYARQAVLTDMSQTGLSPADFAAAYNSGSVCRQTSITRVSAITLYRWKKALSEGGINALEPGYRPPEGAGARTLTKQDRELLQSYFLDVNRPSVAQCVRLIERYHGRKIVYSTARRYLLGLPRALLVQGRLGEKACNDKIAPFINRDIELIAPMDVVGADHHILDILCRHPQKGTPFRPWLTMITDFRSRKPLGWQIGVTPNRYTILRSLQMCVSKYGIPSAIHIDNGKDFKSKLLNGEIITFKNNHGLDEDDEIELQGVFGELGVDVHFVRPYRGQAKPIERFFRTLTETVSKRFPSYVGSNTADRPQDAALYYRRIGKQEKRGDLPDMSMVSTTYDREIHWWAENWPHRGRGMNGRSPSQVFAEESSGPRPVMPPRFRELVFADKAIRVARRTGIELDGTGYYADEIVAVIGQKVLLRRPFDRPDIVHVFDLKGTRLFTAYADMLRDTGDAKENNRLRASVAKRQQKILDQYREAPARTVGILDNLPVAVGAETNAPAEAPLNRKKKPPMSDFFNI